MKYSAGLDVFMSISMGNYCVHSQKHKSSHLNLATEDKVQANSHILYE